MNARNLITEFSSKYPIESSGPFGRQRTTEIITKELPQEILKLCNLNENHFRVYGSAGTGNWAEIPWVAVLDKDITSTTRRGYYIVLLFDREIKNVYICLSLGWTQFEEEYGVKEGRRHIDAACRHYAKLLSDNRGNFKRGNVSLNATHNLGKGYEAGSILFNKYFIDNINDDTIKHDIDELLENYKQLKDLVGDSVLNVDVDTEKYDQQIQSFKKEIAKSTFRPISEELIAELIEKAKNTPPEIRERLIKQIPRNRKYAQYIKQKARYICAICGKKPFTQKNGLPYAEADHVKPLGQKGEDSPINMRCLCAQCHAIITHGSDSEIKQLLS
jgi:5-methylcytosine-specific restriction protein A